MHDQWLLMLAIACLYLYDSALLLFHNEVVFETRGRSYVLSTGSEMQLRGKHLFVPNPCCPHRRLARLSWPDGGLADWRPARWSRARPALALIAPWTWLLLGLFFVALPLALAFGTDVLLLAWLVLTYLSIVAMLAHVYHHRTALGLAPRAVLALAVDVLLCAPFALNIIRKISLRQASAATLHGFALSMLSPDERAILTTALEARICTSLDHVEPDSEQAAALRACLNRYKDDLS